jgi:Flp pilus assembly pilin Flp
MRESRIFPEEASGSVVSEYALLLGLIATALVASLQIFGGAVLNLINTAVAAVTNIP